MPPLPSSDQVSPPSPDMREQDRGEWIDRLLEEAASLATNSFAGVESEGNPCEQSEAFEDCSRPFGHEGSSSDGPVFSHFDTALRQAQNELQSSGPVLPWESGFWGTFFGSADVLDSMLPGPSRVRPEVFVVPPEPSDLIESGPVKKRRVVAQESFAKFVKNREIISWKDQREAEHARALVKWDRVLMSWDSSTDPALAQLAEIEGSDRRMDVLSDSMARKAPATMLKRANSLLRLTGICSNDDGHAMIIGEDVLYQVLRDIKGSGASLSQIRGIMEAITFCRYVFSVGSMDSLCKSSRCWGVGAAKQAYLPTKASPLRVIDLERLHDILANDVSAWQRLFAGCCLFCAYGRTRWSDAQHVDVFTFDKDPETGEIMYIEAVVQVHKTQNLQGRSPKCLELVVFGRGFLDSALP